MKGFRSIQGCGLVLLRPSCTQPNVNLISFSLVFATVLFVAYALSMTEVNSLFERVVDRAHYHLVLVGAIGAIGAIGVVGVILTAGVGTEIVLGAVGAMIAGIGLAVVGLAGAGGGLTGAVGGIIAGVGLSGAAGGLTGAVGGILIKPAYAAAALGMHAPKNIRLV